MAQPALHIGQDAQTLIRHDRVRARQRPADVVADERSHLAERGARPRHRDFSRVLGGEARGGHAGPELQSRNAGPRLTTSCERSAARVVRRQRCLRDDIFPENLIPQFDRQCWPAVNFDHSLDSLRIDARHFDVQARCDAQFDEWLHGFLDVVLNAHESRTALRARPRDFVPPRVHSREPIGQPCQISLASRLPHQPRRSVESGSGSTSSRRPADRCRAPRSPRWRALRGRRARRCRAAANRRDSSC